MSTPKESIRGFILTLGITGVTAAKLTDQTPLRSSGLLDSLALMSLISHIEKEFHIEFSAMELTGDELDSIHDFADLIARKSS